MLKAAEGLLGLLPNSYNSRLTARFSNEFYAFVAGALHPPRQKSSIFTGEETPLRTSKPCPPTATTTAQPTLCNRTPPRPTRRVWPPTRPLWASPLPSAVPSWCSTFSSSPRFITNATDIEATHPPKWTTVCWPIAYQTTKHIEGIEV